MRVKGKNKNKSLILTAVIVLGGVVLIAVGIGRSNLNFYVTIDQLQRSPAESAGRVRVVGEVAERSWKSVGDPGQYVFTLKDEGATLPVRYTGAPITAEPGRQVVVEGVLTKDGTFQADRILTRCESKYSARGKEAARP
jgi:cytochrome c-type biogenesis protein CcmE